MFVRYVNRSCNYAEVRKFTRSSATLENENMKLIEVRGIKIYTPLVEEEEDGRYEKIEKNLLNNVPY